MNMENFFKLYYQYKRKVDALFMVVVGIVLFFLFWFLPPASSAWDKIMYGTGYVCAALSFVCGLLFLFGLVPHNIQKSYDKAEQIVNDSGKAQTNREKASYICIAKYINLLYSRYSDRNIRLYNLGIFLVEYWIFSLIHGCILYL